MDAIVTGHSRGLGAALGARLLDLGARVMGIARRPSAGAASRPDRLHEIALDLSDTAALAAWLRSGELADFVRGSDLAVLINNAGRLEPVAPVGAQGAQEIARAVSLNIAAPLMLADAFVSASRTAPDRRVMHVSSGAAHSPYAGWSVYCASKAALDQHARALRAEAPRGLRVASVAPGVIDTEMQALIRDCDRGAFPEVERFRELKRDGQLQSPDGAARRLVDYLLSDRFGEAATADLRTL